MTDETFFFFAHWMGAPVIDKNNRLAGRLWDLVINPQEPYPPATALVISRGLLPREYAEIPWSQVETAGRTFRLRTSKDSLHFSTTMRADVFRIRKDILDQQVVDLHNHKVIRVNDVHMLAVQPPRVVHVDIGTRGLIRRLGYEGWIDSLLRLMRPSARYLKNEQLLSWKFVKTITLDPLDPIHIQLSADQLANIPPADLGELLMDLDIHQRVVLLRRADPHVRARLFERVGFEQQEQLLEQLSPREAADLLSGMSADEAVDLLGNVPAEQCRQLLSMIESSRARRLSQLLGYEQDEAGGIMTTEYLEIPKTLTVQETIALVKEKTPQLETIYYLYVVDENKQLLGTTTLRQMISASPTDLVTKTVFPKPLYVYTHTPLKEVAFLMDKYKVSALPVISKEKHLQGIITVDDVLHHVIPIAWRRKAGKKHP